MIKYKKLKKLLIWNCKQNKKQGSQLPTATRMAELEEIEPVPSILLPCSSCTRTFRPEVLAKHAKVCEKTLMKKRKKFDSAKQRLQGTDVPIFPSSSKTTTKVKEPPAKTIQSKWREKQADLARTLQATRKKSDPTVLKVKPSDHEQCPHCERFFGPKAYDRHTEWCKEQQIKIKNNNSTYNEARERLQVRTKYRAPLTNKILTRDKYSPNPTRSREPSPMSVPKISEEANRSKVSSPLDRASSLRISGRSRTVVVNKNTPVSPRTSNEPKLHHSSSITSDKKDPISSSNYEKPKPKFYPEAAPKKKEADKYDPFVSAEQQLMELFNTGNKPRSDVARGADEPSNPNPVKTSPLSAFAIYSPIKNNNRSDSTESLKIENKENNENNNLDSSDDTVSPPPEEKIDNRKNFSLSNLSLCSIISLDSIDCNRNPVIGKQSRGRSEYKRSSSAVETKSVRHGSRVKVNMQQMLYGKSSPDPPISPASSTDVGNLEACEAELLVSMLEFEKMLNSSPVPSLEPSSPLCSSTNPNEKPTNEDTDNKKQQNFASSIDSAYSSLTRATGEGDSMRNEASRFCHECGARYPVPVAKFCCNCGIRRIAI